MTINVHKIFVLALLVDWGEMLSPSRKTEILGT